MIKLVWTKGGDEMTKSGPENNVVERLQFESLMRSREIPIEDVIILPQERHTFDPLKITDLAENIGRMGLLTNIKLAVFTSKAKFIEYLLFSADLHGATLEFDDYKSYARKGKYYVLIAGECRIRAMIELREKGCSRCKVDGEESSECHCFEIQFPKSAIRWCDIYVNPDPFYARCIQVSENIHGTVPAHEEAYFVESMLKMYRKRDAQFSYAKLAKELGCSPNKVSRMIKFCGLPDRLRKAVENSKMKYGFAIEMARLADHKFGEKTLETELRYVISQGPRLSIPKYRRRITERIASLVQMDLAAAMDYSVQADTEKAFRNAIKSLTGDGLQGIILTFEGMKWLCEQHLLSTADSPMTDPENRKRLGKVLDHLDSCLGQVQMVINSLEGIGLPHLAKLARHLISLDPKKVKRLTRQTRRLLDAIDELTAEESQPAVLAGTGQTNSG